jgi:MFS family permease
LLAGGFTFFYGRVYDKFKFFKSVYIPLILLIGGYLFLFCFTNVVCVFIGSLFMMCGYLSGMAVFGAVIRDYTPINKSGMFQGLRIVGQVLIPGVVGPFIGAKVLKNAEMVLNSDGTLSFLPNRNIFLASLVVILIVVILIAIIHLLSKKYKNILKLPTSND